MFSFKEKLSDEASELLLSEFTMTSYGYINQSDGARTLVLCHGHTAHLALNNLIISRMLQRT